MGWWNNSPHQIETQAAEDFAHAPSGGRMKAWLLGVGLALWPIGYGLHCLDTGHARFLGSRGSHLDLTGSAAIALAVAYLCIGAFIHAHWFWGLHRRLAPWSHPLKAIAILVFLGCLGFTIYKVFS